MKTNDNQLLFIYYDGNHYFKNEYGYNAQILCALLTEDGNIVSKKRFNPNDTIQIKTRPKKDYYRIEVNTKMSKFKGVDYYPREIAQAGNQDIIDLKLPQLSEKMNVQSEKKQVKKPQLQVNWDEEE